MSADSLLEFWFGDWSDASPLGENDAQMAKWWMKSPALDAELRDRFGSAHFKAASGELGSLRGTDAVAVVLLLDQIPRNIFRHTPHMFATDGLAQQAALRLLDGEYDTLAPIHRYFALMPLMHAEDLSLHDLAVERFSALAQNTASTARAKVYTAGLDYEHKHRVIIERFGRYPHRNALLGRPSTPDEAAFLKTPGSSF